MKTSLFEMAIARNYKKDYLSISDIAEHAFKYNELYVYKNGDDEYLFISFKAVKEIIKDSKELDKVIASIERFKRKLFDLDKKLSASKDIEPYFLNEYSDEFQHLINKCVASVIDLKTFCESIFNEVCEFNYVLQGFNPATNGNKFETWQCSSYKNGNVTKGDNVLISFVPQTIYGVGLDVRQIINSRMEYSSPVNIDKNIELSAVLYYFDDFIKNFRNNNESEEELYSLLELYNNINTTDNTGIVTKTNGGKYLNFTQKLDIKDAKFNCFLRLNCSIYPGNKNGITYSLSLSSEEDD